MYECYVYGKSGGKVCYACNEKVAGYKYPIKIKGNKVVKYPVKRCIKCGIVHIAYNEYLLIKDNVQIKCLNATDIEKIKNDNKLMTESIKRNKQTAKKNKNSRILGSGNSQSSSKIYKSARVMTINAKPVKKVINTSITTSNGLCNYCMCELQDISTKKMLKVTVNNGTLNEFVSLNEMICTPGNDYADACLKAAANELDEVIIKGKKYKVIRYVRYDAAFVDTYEERTTEKISVQSWHTFSDFVYNSI